MMGWIRALLLYICRNVAVTDIICLRWTEVICWRILLGKIKMFLFTTQSADEIRIQQIRGQQNGMSAYTHTPILHASTLGIVSDSCAFAHCVALCVIRLISGGPFRIQYCMRIELRPFIMHAFSNCTHKRDMLTDTILRYMCMSTGCVVCLDENHMHVFMCWAINRIKILNKMIHHRISIELPLIGPSYHTIICDVWIIVSKKASCSELIHWKKNWMEMFSQFDMMLMRK